MEAGLSEMGQKVVAADRDGVALNTIGDLKVDGGCANMYFVYFCGAPFSQVQLLHTPSVCCSDK